MNPFDSVRRLDPCPCGSARRYKDCHGRLAPVPELARALALRTAGASREARAALEPLFAAAPPEPEAWNLAGLIAQDELDLARAKASFRRAIELAPAFPEAHFNLGLALLLEGDYVQGWAEFEWRTRRPGYRDYANHRFGMPRWQGEPLAGRTLLVHAEQGQGDTIQFARFIEGYAEQGATVDLFCHPPLVSLMARVPGVRHATDRLDERPRHDFHAPILDLGVRRLLAPGAAHWRHAYLAPLPERAARWAPEIRAVPRPRVGIAWKGSALHANDANRSLTPALAARLLAAPAGYVNLQTDHGVLDAGERVALDAGPRIADWDDTAAILAELDLVVTVDTAVAHLAGAMGKPVWTLVPFSPDWRWGLGREDTAWYPSMRLYRQERRGEWGPVMERIAAELGALARSGAA